jgi:hypothetical protein
MADTCAGILKQSMGARNRVGISLSNRPARARICKRFGSQESIPQLYVTWRAGTTNMVVAPARQAWNRFLGSLKGLQIQAQATQPGGIASLESILGLLKFFMFGLCPAHLNP